MKDTPIVSFTKKYKSTPDLVVSSPGRINLIGDHTDYNDGLVLPAAIDRHLELAFSRNNSEYVNVESTDLEQTFSCRHDIGVVKHRDWSSFPESVLIILGKHGYQFSGCDVVLGGNIPAGAGLSSSAALNCGLIFGIGELFGLGLSNLEVITMAQEAEHLIGLNCGIMDQFVVMHGKKDCFLELDCRDLSYKLHSSSFTEHSIVLLDTRVKHKLTDSSYNKRRQECEHVLKVVRSFDETVQSVRDIQECHLHRAKDKVDLTSLRRVQYIIRENQRVIDAGQALHDKDYKGLGDLLYESHKGLSEEYEVSCKESDFLVDFTRDNEHVLGARQMGGGFGGCIITIIENGFEEEFIEEVRKAYLDELEIELIEHHVSIGDGLKTI